MSKNKWSYFFTGCEVLLIVALISFSLLRQPPWTTGAMPMPGVPGLRVIYQPVNEPADIKSLSGPRISPIVYTNVIPLGELNVKVKKRKFFSLVLPSILISKYKLSLKRKKLRAYMEKDRLEDAEQEWLDRQLARFRAKDYKGLLRRMADHPNSIILAQAAMESGWGESRFFTDSNNVFGVWSFDPDEPRVKARETREGKVIFVKEYESLIESVDDYFLTIARGPYREFRQARLLYDDPEQLATHLTNYSEQRAEYVRRLQEFIEANNLRRFDDYHLDPDFISGR